MQPLPIAWSSSHKNAHDPVACGTCAAHAQAFRGLRLNVAHWAQAKAALFLPLLGTALHGSYAALQAEGQRCAHGQLLDAHICVSGARTST